MKTALRFDPLEAHPAFEAMIGSITWDAGRPPDRLGVLMSSRGLGCLAIHSESNLPDGDDPAVSDVLLISDRLPDREELPVPSTRAEILAQGGKYTYNSDGLAKGRSVLGVNMFQALVRGHVRESVAAVRLLSLPRGLGGASLDIYVGRGSDSWLSRKTREFRHGIEYAGVITEDGFRGRRVALDLPESATPKTNRAVARRERLYGGAVCALLPLSPSWYKYQRDHKIGYGGVRPAHVLANGAVKQPPLRRVGRCEVPIVKPL